jgi:glycosyltransferase involved in cell wall biosynthesis
MTTKVEMVSVVIPTLNEAGNILEALTTIQKELTYPKEIIVVDGASTDGTREIVKDTKFCKLIVEPRRGYGLALRTGIKHAKGDVVVMVDGDGTYEVKHINRLLDALIENDAEIVLATRMYDPNKAMGFMNFVGNKIITFCFDFLYSQFLSDTQSGFRAISHSAIEKVDLDQDDMAFATEMLVQFAKKGFKMVEVNSVYKKRRYGRTKLRRIKSGVEIFTTMVKGFMK